MGIDPFSLGLVAPSEIREFLSDDGSVERLRKILTSKASGFVVNWHEYLDPSTTGNTLLVVEKEDPSVTDITLELIDSGLVVDSIKRIHKPEVAQILETHFGKQEI